MSAAVIRIGPMRLVVMVSTIRLSLIRPPIDRMTFSLLPDGSVLMRVKNKSVMALAGSLRKKGRKAIPVRQLSR